MWGDPRLMWNPKNYSGVTYIQAPASKFWMPDLSVMNAAGATNLVAYASTQNVGIDNEGISYLTLSLPNQQTRCALNFKKYPYDSQKCSIIVGSWIYNSHQVNLIYNDEWTASKINITDKSKYIEHPYWELASFTKSWVFDSTRYLWFNKFRNVSLQSVDMSFDLVLKRRPMYVMVNSIYINFILNMVILVAFRIPDLKSQITLCKILFVFM